VLVDPTGRQAGRGAYLCADGSCWRTTSTKRALDRALATPLPAEILAMLDAGAPEPDHIEGGARGQE
jgi:predicted RNA-binding protein YlxR (DUF448 family)